MVSHSLQCRFIPLLKWRFTICFLSDSVTSDIFNWDQHLIQSSNGFSSILQVTCPAACDESQSLYWTDIESCRVYIVGGFNPFPKKSSNWIISPGRAHRASFHNALAQINFDFFSGTQITCQLEGLENPDLQLFTCSIAYLIFAGVIVGSCTRMGISIQVEIHQWLV